jgi:hypothetical protein
MEVEAACPRLNIFYEFDIGISFPIDTSMKTDFLSVCLKTVEKIQVSLQSDKNNGYFTCRPMYIFDHISLSFS